MSFFTRSLPRYYPDITVENNQNPNKLYAIPLLGGLIKIILSIPLIFILIFFQLFVFLSVIVNTFVVLFSGKYWLTSYEFVIDLIRFNVKFYLWWAGVTDTYPGFDFQIKDNYKVEVINPQQSNRLFAIPFLGLFARVLLLIPFFIFSSLIENAGRLAAVCASVVVLFSGKYPESLYELVCDSIRLQMASTVYMFGVSDTYPSFYISMKHKKVKIIFIIIAALITLFSAVKSENSKQNNNSGTPRYNYSQTY